MIAVTAMGTDPFLEPDDEGDAINAELICIEQAGQALAIATVITLAAALPLTALVLP
ncbi:hypothetical protein [uncultured Novosphingobium sp.]|uniref:hypothetical protein n=1 Tax=uncultured Novosphingobium sp. TaxID=292277 RepID=UPI00258EDC35|nr:hypothetical protein [uncultured Novosphingobium sp.]